MSQKLKLEIEEYSGIIFFKKLILFNEDYSFKGADDELNKV